MISTCNGEISIGSLVLRTKNYVDNVAVIDGGSTDATSDIAKLAGAIVIKSEKNGSYDSVLQSGFKFAKEYDFNDLVIFDSNGGNDPSCIPLLIKKLDEGADVVIGSKSYICEVNDSKSIESNLKKLDFSNNQSEYHAFSKNAIDKIILNDSYTSVGSEILTQIKKNNLKVKEVQLTIDDESDNLNKSNIVGHLIARIINIARAVETNRPLYYFGGAGSIMILSAFFLALQLIQRYNNDSILPFGPTILMMLLIIVGLLTTFTGVMLYVISRLEKEMIEETYEI